MGWIIEEIRKNEQIYLKISARFIGSDVLLWVEGGERPHIGCVVQAVPRKSLTGSAANSTTASVLNLTGHKDEFLCRKIAETVCRELGVVVVCTGGVHIDHITGEQIEEIQQAAGEMTGALLKKLKKG